MHSKMSKSHANEVSRLLRTKITSRMTGVELAKVWAAQRGYYSREGGWIYSHCGMPIAQGWTAFAEHLVHTGDIKVGKGINWTKSQHFAPADGIDPRKER